MQFQSVERLLLILFSDSKSMNWEMTISLERKASRKLSAEGKESSQSDSLHCIGFLDFVCCPI